MYYCYDENEFQTVFWDEKNKLITIIHENDATWRKEYMNKIPNHFGIEVKQVNKLPKEIKNQLQ